MSRDFNGTTSGLARTSNAITAFPFTIGIWFNPDTLTGSDKFLFSAHDNPGVGLVVAGALDSGDSWKPYLGLYDGSYKIVKATTGATTGSWQSAMFVATSASSYTAYYNGGSAATNTTPVTMTLSDMNRMALGKQSFAAAGYFDGKQSHTVIWNTALTATDAAIFHAGLFPRRIKPASLVAHWSNWAADASTEIDPIGRFDMTATDAPRFDSEPRIFQQVALG